MAFFRRKDPYALPDGPPKSELPPTAEKQVRALLAKGWKLEVKHDGPYTNVRLNNENGEQRANFDLKSGAIVPSTDTVKWSLENLAPAFYRLPPPRQALTLLELHGEKS